MRKPVISGNWKMYNDIPAAVSLVEGIKKGVTGVNNVEMIVIPPYIDIACVKEAVKGSMIGFGAQNLHWEEEGAFTGEISAKMLKSAGCQYVVIGHSERRKYFGETDETVNRKVKAAIQHGIIPIMCVGETLEERESGKTMNVVKQQVEGGLKGLDADFLKTLIIAYEPVWAIGTGKTATPAQAQEVHAMIRKLLAALYSAGFSAACRILYGGSVKPDNVESLMKEEDIDGGLIGGASLKADSFIDMVKTTSKLYANK